MLARPTFFSGAYLDRRTEARAQTDWLDSALADPHTQFLLVRDNAQLLFGGLGPRIAFVSGRHPAVAAAEAHQFVLLGWFRQRRCVLLMLAPEWQDIDLPEGAGFQELRALSPQLAPEEAGLAACARALSIWRGRQRYCGVCGAPAVPARAGHSVVCGDTACGQEFFPRLEPAIIVLVTDGAHALLGRQQVWEPGRYSTIAGFVEPGESLEDAVCREVMEETGIQVLSTCYDGSQPWPFPASLMIGFQAVAAPGVVRVGGELEDARWFTRAEVEGGAVRLPPAYSISRRLIDSWLGADP